MGLLEDLEEPFGERTVLRVGGVIREYECITRGQGETVHQFISRFRQLEEIGRKFQILRVSSR